MAHRGELTHHIQLRATELLGQEITVRELRMMPYIQYVMTNDQRIDPNKVNGEERLILKKWREAGHIAGGASGLSITREFWDIISSLIFLAYVAYREPDDAS